ncbi:MAG: DUF1684 domain-containing protein [Bacteroidota bacterium]
MRFALLVFTVLIGCAAEAPPSVDRAQMAERWGEWVTSRDSLFRSPVSPLADTTGFDGLSYFPYDSTLAVSAVLVPAVSQDTVAFPTTTGELRPMISAGHLVFEASGVQWRLEAFRSVFGTADLFVPFRDATNNRQTYGGGRYLDLEEQPSGRYALDLNRAYNPYCVYDVSYSCPLPPAENTLELAVTAGETMP